jgi:hypothetical protein
MGVAQTNNIHTVTPYTPRFFGSMFVSLARWIVKLGPTMFKRVSVAGSSISSVAAAKVSS